MTGQSNENGKDAGLQRQLRDVKQQLADQSKILEDLRRNQDLQVTIYNGFHAIEEALIPIRGLSPVREPTKDEAKAIVLLRASLRRPQFELLDGHFPPSDPFEGKGRESAA
jgi:hypothetical protein